MNIVKLIPIVALAIPLIATADIQGKPYIFSGHAAGQKICRAIAEDNVVALRNAVRADTPLATVRLNYSNYLCNTLDLRSFAQEVGATDVASFLGEEVDSVEKKVALDQMAAR